jgi:NADH-quinone oxidoreductase subunit N
VTAEFQAPSIEYSLLSPLLIIAGVAIVGVLVEAYAPRRLRYVVQTLLALAGVR